MTTQPSQAALDLADGALNEWRAACYGGRDDPSPRQFIARAFDRIIASQDSIASRLSRAEKVIAEAADGWKRLQAMYDEQDALRKSGRGVHSGPRDAFEAWLDDLVQLAAAYRSTPTGTAPPSDPPHHEEG